MITTEMPKYPINIEGVDEKDVIRFEGRDSKWVKLTCHWKKKTGEKDGRLYDNFEIKYLYNIETKKVYNDDEKKILASKLSMLSFATPIYIVGIKTAYHAFLPASLPVEIHKELKKIKAEKKTNTSYSDLAFGIIKGVGKNVADLIKSPLVGTAMTVTALGSLILSPIQPQILYVGRDWFGTMQNFLTWGDKKSKWTLAPCMLPLADLNKKEKKLYYVAEDTIYDGDPGTAIHGLNNLVRRQFTYDTIIDIPSETKEFASSENSIPDTVIEIFPIDTVKLEDMINSFANREQNFTAEIV